MNDEETVAVTVAVTAADQGAEVEAAPSAGLPPPVARPAESAAMTAFASARDALVAERKKLVEAQESVLRQIAEIDFVLGTKIDARPAKADTNRLSGATVKLRAAFAGAPNNRLTTEQAKACLPKAEQAHALLHNMLRSKQIRRVRSGVYEALPKLFDLMKQD